MLRCDIRRTIYPTISNLVLLFTMTHSSPLRVPAPCIINVGTIVHKTDMLRVLSRLSHVSYTHICGGERRSQGSASVVEVLIHSFDYLELRQDETEKTLFVLVRGDEHLCLKSIPCPIDEDMSDLDPHQTLSGSSLEFALAHIIAAKLDAHLDATSDIDDTTW